jgi:CBS domain-containing protein
MTSNVARETHRSVPAPSVAPISTFVHAPLVSIASNAALRTATRVMRLHDVGAIAVVDGGQLTGILSERDVAVAIAAGADPDAAFVGAWMRSPPASAHLDDCVIDTSVTMLHNQLRCIPVFGAHGERTGFVRLDEMLLPMLRAEEPPQHRMPYMAPD